MIPYTTLIQRRPNIKHTKLRLNVEKQQIIISTHLKTPLQLIKRFLGSSHTWILEQIKIWKPPLQFVPNLSISILGQTYILKHINSITLSVIWEKDEIIIHGSLDQFDRYVRIALKEKIHDLCQTYSYMYAAQLRVKICKLRVKDMKTRYGSCSTKGSLNYNWRLIFAPLEVIQYLCAHEVAHLVHMNHSKEFWGVVDTLCKDAKKYRQWLRINQKQLFKF